MLLRFDHLEERSFTFDTAARAPVAGAATTRAATGLFIEPTIFTRWIGSTFGNDQQLLGLMARLDNCEREHRIRVYLRFLNELTLAGRSIWHHDSMSSETRLEGMRRINEINHRTLNHIHGIQSSEDGVAVMWYAPQTEAMFAQVLIDEAGVDGEVVKEVFSAFRRAMKREGLDGQE